MSDFRSLTTMDERPVDAMSAAQISIILGLDSVLQHAGLILTCPRCAADGHPQLATENSAEDPVWRIDCQCRRRRVMRSDSAPMKASGDLLLLAAELLTPLGLTVRCPSKRCLLHPLEMAPALDGLRVTCRCGTYHFQKTVLRPH